MHYVPHEDRRGEIEAALNENPSAFLASTDAFEIVHFGGVYLDGNETDIAAVVRRSDGLVVALEGGCDYTGWGCQDHLDVNTFDSVDDALANGITTDGRSLIAQYEAEVTR